MFLFKRKKNKRSSAVTCAAQTLNNKPSTDEKPAEETLFRLDSARNRYIAATVIYTDTYARFARLKELCENGEYVSLEMAQGIAQLLQDLSDARDNFFMAQKEMGYGTGDMFLENCSFRGFSIEKGQLIGNCEDAYRIAYPWYFDYVNGQSDNNFKFEVACLLVNLTNVGEYSLAG